jgi:hypothetical protein
VFVTSAGSPHGRFSRAIRTKNLWAAEMSLRELRDPSLVDLLDYLELLAEVKPEKLETAAVRWHGRLETETTGMRLADAQLVLALLTSLRAGDPEAIDLLRRQLRRLKPTLTRGFE